jgi:lysophospholipase L1-like esterase
VAHLTIAAMGSSFAAGPGILPLADERTGRSARNYAHQLAERLDARLVDLTVSGATTANLVTDPQVLLDGTILRPQATRLPTDADVVTITAGGNDLQFAGAMLAVALTRAAPDSPLLPMVAPVLADGIPNPSDAEVEHAVDGLVRVIDAVRARAPHARLLLVDYLTVLDEDSVAATPFGSDEIRALMRIQDRVAQVFRDAAARSSAELVVASALSVDHALGSSDPWVQPFRADPAASGGSFHPNEAGMTAIAAELERVLRT